MEVLRFKINPMFTVKGGYGQAMTEREATSGSKTESTKIFYVRESGYSNDSEYSDNP